jgi:hypothetical protein
MLPAKIWGVRTPARISPLGMVLFVNKKPLFVLGAAVYSSATLFMILLADFLNNVAFIVPIVLSS